MADANDAAKIAIMDRFQEIAKQWRFAEKIIQEQQEIIQTQQEIKKHLEIKAQDCHAAARLFNFDIVAELSRLAENKTSENESSTPPSIGPSPQSLPKPATIKELVLAEAKGAYPNPVRATDLRRKLEELRGETLHEKTIGMTLYRLLKDGKLTRKNWDWTYVQQA